MASSMASIDKNMSGRKLIYWLIAVLLLNSIMVIFLYVELYQANTVKIEDRRYNMSLEDIKSKTKYYDEVLSMSARLYSFTGDEAWRTRYLENASKLDDIISRSQHYASNSYNNILASVTGEANDKRAEIEAFALEKQAIGLPWQDNPLFGEEYQALERVYRDGIENFEKSIQNNVRLSELKSRIAYIDEVLTMSARMAAFTGSPHWEKRYLEFVPLLDASIGEALELSNKNELEPLLDQVSDANVALIALEEASFVLVAKGDLKGAQTIMFGSDYLKQKAIYSTGMKKIGESINNEVTNELQAVDQKTRFSAILVLVLFLLLIILAFIAIRGIRAWELMLERQNIELTSKKNELEILAYSMSHDLKAPLKTILGFSRRISKQMEKGNVENLSVLNNHIHKNAEKLDVLVDDIMEIIKSENMEDVSEKVDFHEIETHIREGVYTLGHESVEFITSFNHSNGFYGYKRSLKQVLENLVGNAFKYSNPEVENPLVKLETANEVDGSLKIVISDNGIGIPESMHKKVFSMFFRADSDKSFGSGLGLYLVKKQIENMKGTISFSSSNEGTQFTIILP